MCVCVCVCAHVYMYIYNGILLSHKKEATWMYLEMILLSEVSQAEKDKLSYITNLWNQKNDTNELIYKAEIDSQI